MRYLITFITTVILFCLFNLFVCRYIVSKHDEQSQQQIIELQEQIIKIKIERNKIDKNLDEKIQDKVEREVEDKYDTRICWLEDEIREIKKEPVKESKPWKIPSNYHECKF